MSVSKTFRLLLVHTVLSDVIQEGDHAFLAP